MEASRIIKEALITATGIVVAAFVLSYAINLGGVWPALNGLLLWTIMVAFLSIGGRVLGAVAGVSGAMRASIVAPEVAGYARGAVRTAHDELSSWVGHLLGIGLSILVSIILKNVLLFIMIH